MLKLLSVNKNQGVVLITMLVLMMLGASYFFIYVPDNEKIVQQRRFRCLQNIDNNIKAKIENSVSSLDYLLKTNSVNGSNNFIADYPTNNFTLLPIDSMGVTTKVKKLLYTRDDSLVTITIDPNSQQFTLYLSRLRKNKNNPNSLDSLSMGIRYRFDQFIKPLLTTGVFDNYIVFIDNEKDDKGKDSKIVSTKPDNKLVYETFPSGLSYKTKDSLLSFKNGVVSPGVRSLNIGGADYKVFSQPINVDVNSKWIIVGLVLNKNYQQEKNQLPLWIILLLLTAAIGMIVSLPWIKLYHMGSKDKLTVADGVSSILVSIMFMSLLFFAFFKYNFKINGKQPAASESALANQTITAFQKNLTVANNLLDSFDKVYIPGISIRRLGKHDNLNSGKIDSPLLLETRKLLKENARNIAVDEVFWLDTTGKELDNWTTHNDFTPHSDLSSRDYFQNIIKNKPNKTGNPQFYIDQVVSRSSGFFTSVIAKKALKGHHEVAAISFAPKSLDSVIMPDGYQFAIIDNTSKVLYHSQPERNLNEYLTREFADSISLVSCLQAKSDTSFDAEYYGRRYNIKIKPFTEIPYFIVIFEDQEYNDARDTEAYAFTLSMLICLVIFQVVQISTVFIVSSKRSFFKKQLFDTSWVGPKQSLHREYNLSIVANCIIIILQIIFYYFSSFLEYLFILLFSITFIALYLNSIFALSYQSLNRYNSRFKRIAVQWLCLFVLIIDYAAYKNLTPWHFSFLLLFEILSVVLCNFSPDILRLARKPLYPIVSRYRSNSSITWNYTRSFSLMATTQLIITSGIPVAFFFIYSFNYEQNLDTRYRQVNFARALVQKVPADNITDTKLDDIKNDEMHAAGVYYDGVYIKDINIPRSKENIDSTNESYNALNILSSFRLLVNAVEIKSDNMNSPKIGNEAQFNNMADEEGSSRNTITTTYYNIGSKGKFIKLSSINNNYKFPDLFVWLLFFVAIFGFYYILHNIIKKLFALKLPSTEKWGKLDEQLLLDNDMNRLLLVVGPPGSGKLQKLLKLIREGRLTCNMKKSYYTNNVDEKELLVYNPDDPSNPSNNVFIADMMLISADNGEFDKDWKDHKQNALNDYSLVIINHFEYNIKDSRANKIKLDFLELLMEKDNSKVIIISTVHPLTFLDSFNELNENPMPESELERWHVLLGHFRIVFQPLETTHTPRDPDILRRTLIQETQHTHFLTKMQPMILSDVKMENDIDSIGPESDSLIFKLQITSHYFYTYIWQSLTKEEKFLLYDLAEDGLVNPYDDYNLSMLICKGLIIKPEGTLMLFNKGFRNFILTSIGHTEAERIKAQVADNGNWGSLRTPLILATIAILVFLIASQQEAYTRIITYITALGAGVPAILRVFSMFGNSNQQKTS